MRYSIIPFLALSLVTAGCIRQPSTKLVIQQFQFGNELISNSNSDHIRIKGHLPVRIDGIEVGSVCQIPWGFEYREKATNRIVPLIHYGDYSESIAIIQGSDQKTLFILWALPGIILRPSHFISVLNLSTLVVEHKKINGGDYDFLRNKFQK